MPRNKLTDHFVRSLKPPAEGQVDYFDLLLPSFGLRVARGGTKTWQVLTRVHGRVKRIKVGRYPAMELAAARTKARALLDAADAGNDPAAVLAEEKAEKQSELFENVLDDFARKYLKKQGLKRADEIEAALRRYILPKWRGRDLRSITRREAIDLFENIAEEGKPVMANRVLAYTRKLMNWALHREIIEANPLARIQEKPGGAETSRDRVLDADEIRRLWHAAKEIDYPFGTLTKLLLATGQRLREVAEMTWREIDLEGDKPTWTLAAERTKSGRPHIVPLSPLAVAILAEVRRQSGDYVLSTTAGKRPVSGFSRAKQQLDRKIKEAVDIANAGRPKGERIKFVDWRFHDLRRSVTTGCAAFGVSPAVLARILNHSPKSSQGITAVYNRFEYADEMRRALDAWAAHLRDVIEQKPRPGNVVALAEARG